MIGFVAVSVALVGIVGYLMLPKGGDGPANPDGLAATSPETSDTATTQAPALSSDDEAILADFRKMILGLGKSKATPEQRKAAMEAFAADRNMSTADVLAIAEKDRQAREAANKVEGNWQPLQIGQLASPGWPAETGSISVPVAFGGAVFSLPAQRTPFVLASASLSGGIQRHVFDLAASQEAGHWTNNITASRLEQLSLDGQLVCLQKGFKPPITLHIANAKTGEIIQEISSPDIHRVTNLAFIGPKQLMVLTPLTGERSRVKKLRCLIFDATTGKEESRFEREFHFSGIERMSLSPAGRYLVATGKGKSIEVIDMANGKQICALDLKDEGLPNGQLHSVAFSPNGRQIAVLEHRPLLALRLYIIDSATGEITRKADLYGGTSTLGASLEMQLQNPLVWFPNGRYALIGKLAAIDATTGRRVWQAQGKQTGNNTARLPTADGLLYQVNAKGTSKLVSLPIDFGRIAATQAAWPADALLSPGMTASVSIDLSAGGLEEINGILTTAMTSKLEGLGFAVSAATDRVLSVGMRSSPDASSGELSVAFTWSNGGGDVLWESIAVSDSAMVPQLGHMKGKTAERAMNSEGVAKLLAYPIPYFLSADAQWTLPIIDQIDHEGEK